MTAPFLILIMMLLFRGGSIQHLDVENKTKLIPQIGRYYRHIPRNNSFVCRQATLSKTHIWNIKTVLVLGAAHALNWGVKGFSLPTPSTPAAQPYVSADCLEDPSGLLPCLCLGPQLSDGPKNCSAPWQARSKR